MGHDCIIPLLAALCIAMTITGCVSMSIDQAIVAAYQSVDAFDRLADPSGSVIRHELDMLLTKEQAEALDILHTTESMKDDPTVERKRRKAIRDVRYRWPANTIPYSIASNIFTNTQTSEIQAAIDEWEKYTCIRFRAANSDDSNKVHFDNGTGCASYIGMVRGSQKIHLATGCRTKGVIVHEIGHAVGFHHEQNRPDRDDYVTIHTDNVISRAMHNFQKYPLTAINPYGVPYDYGSIMHYGSYYFSNNGQMTIRTKDPKDQSKIGNRQSLAFSDIMTANKMYECSKQCDQSIQCPNGAFLGKDCKCKCPGYPVTECAATGKVATTTAGPTKKPTTPASCEDQNENCQAWTNKDKGYCHFNFLKTYCKKSCELCPGEEVTEKPECRDLKYNCPYWGNMGFCTGDFEMFMSESCPKTCKLCDGSNEEGENAGNTGNKKDAESGAVGFIVGSSSSSLVLILTLLSCLVINLVPNKL